MKRDFARVDAALASSAAAGALMYLNHAIRAAWRSSSAGAAARSTRAAIRAMPAATRIRTTAMAVLIAAMLQPLLMRAMPATVVPAMPWPAFALIAIFAALAAWQAEAIARAWPTSALTGMFRR
jgi:hypothetical protein